MRRAEEKRRRTRATDDVEQLIFRSCYYKKKKGGEKWRARGERQIWEGFGESGKEVMERGRHWEQCFDLHLIIE